MKSFDERTITETDRAKAPVFVVGCTRSGSTFLYDTILSSGNFAVYHADSDVFNRIAPVYGDRRLRLKANREKLMNMWLQSDHFKRTGLIPDKIRAEVLSDCRNAGDFLRIVMERTAQNQGVERWADSTNAYLLHMLRIKATIPNALFIHNIRDGRDVATSLNHLGWPFEPRCPWDRDHGLLVSAIYWEWMVRKGREYGRRLGADYVEVRYEDLVRQPRETLKMLSSFIHHDLNYERIQKNSIGTVRTPNSSFGGATSRDTFKPIGRWKGLGGAEAERMEALLAPLLEELGYEVNRSANLDFTAWRMRAFYRVYRDLKQRFKRTPFARFGTCMDRFETGFLDRETAYFQGLQDSARRSA
jgi:Sulfotransferase family